MEKFEELLKELEEIVDALEKGELTLDEAIKKYERGMFLAKQCSDKLQSAKECVVKKMEEK